MLCIGIDPAVEPAKGGKLQAYAVIRDTKLVEYGLLSIGALRGLFTILRPTWVFIEDQYFPEPKGTSGRAKKEHRARTEETKRLAQTAGRIVQLGRNVGAEVRLFLASEWQGAILQATSKMNRDARAAIARRVALALIAESGLPAPRKLDPNVADAICIAEKGVRWWHGEQVKRRARQGALPGKKES